MSHHVTTPVLACFYGSGNLMLLAIALADACPDASGKGIYKSVARLAHESRTSVRTAQSALRRLQADGWLIKDSAGNGGRGHATRYRVDAEWLARARQEIADASRDNRPPALVVGPADWRIFLARARQELAEASLDGAVVPENINLALSEAKGAELAPFTAVDNSPQRVQIETLKGAENGLKGATAVAPEQRTEYINTPLPPESGGVRDFEKLETEFPRHHVADRSSAYRVWRILAPDAQRQEVMLAALRASKNSPQWQADDGRWVPKLSRWLRGWQVGDGPPMPEVPEPAPQKPPPRVLSPEELAANKARATAAREDLRRMRARDSLSGSERVMASMCPPRVGSTKEVA